MISFRYMFNLFGDYMTIVSWRKHITNGAHTGFSYLTIFEWLRVICGVFKTIKHARELCQIFYAICKRAS